MTNLTHFILFLAFSFCNIQLSITMLRISWRRGKYHVRNTWKAHQVVMYVWDLLSCWKNLHNWFLEILQTSHTSILPCQACDGFHYHFPSIERSLSRWWLERKHWIHLHHNNLQCFRLTRTLWTVFVLLCDERFAYSIWSCAQVLYNQIGYFPQFLARWEINFKTFDFEILIDSRLDT